MSPHDDSKAPSIGRVLLAEDDDELRWLFARELREAGLEVIEARNGAELLDILSVALAESLDLESIDIIVSDIYMPGFTGMEILRGLSNAEWRRPFILVTAFGDATLRREAAAHGAVTVLDKPLDLAVLRRVVVSTLQTPPPSPRRTH